MAEDGLIGYPHRRGIRVHISSRTHLIVAAICRSGKWTARSDAFRACLKGAIERRHGVQFRVDHETISLCRHAAPIAEVKRSGDRHLTDKVNGAVGKSVGRPEDGRTRAARGRRARSR